MASVCIILKFYSVSMAHIVFLSQQNFRKAIELLMILTAGFRKGVLELQDNEIGQNIT